MLRIRIGVQTDQDECANEIEYADLHIVMMVGWISASLADEPEDD